MSKLSLRLMVKGKGKRASGGRAAKLVGIVDVLDAADVHMEAYDLEQAAPLYERALQMDPSNTRAMEGLAALLLEVGNTDVAKGLLERAVAIEPSTGHSKFMSLAQLQEGMDALMSYQRGLAILEPHISSPAHLSEYISSLCAMAELYMTDLCYEDGAEAACDGLLAQALVKGPENFEVHQSVAHLRASQQKPDEALVHVRKAAELMQSLNEDQMPPISFRLGTARLMLELEQVGSAMEMLKKLIAEDDELIETWYTLSVALMQDGSLDMALAAVGRAHDLQVSETGEASGPITELRSQILKKAKEQGVDLSSSSITHETILESFFPSDDEEWVDISEDMEQ